MTTFTAIMNQAEMNRDQRGPCSFVGVYTKTCLQQDINSLHSADLSKCSRQSRKCHSSYALYCTEAVALASMRNPKIPKSRDKFSTRNRRKVFVGIHSTSRSSLQLVRTAYKKVAQYFTHFFPLKLLKIFPIYFFIFFSCIHIIVACTSYDIL